jgi:hypothetical protein
MRKSMIQSMVKYAWRAPCIPVDGLTSSIQEIIVCVVSLLRWEQRGLICCILRCLMNPHESGEPTGNVCVRTSCGFFCERSLH